MDNNKKDWRPIWLYILITIIGSILVGFVFATLSIKNGKSINSSNDVLGAISTIVVDVIITIIFLILYHKRLKTDFKKLSKKNIIYIIISAVILVSLNELISYLFRLFEVDMNNQNTITSYLQAYKIPMAISIVSLAPFIEEMTFRYSIETLCKNKIVFVIVSSVVFGLAHDIGISTLLYTLMGACLSIAYIKNDKNILVPISIHALNNLVAAIELLLFS